MLVPALLLASAALPGSSPAPRDPAPRPMVMAAAVRRACIYVMTGNDRSTDKWKPFCELKPFTEEGFLANWGALTRSQIPSPAQVDTLARKLSEDKWKAERAKSHAEFEPSASGPAGPEGSTAIARTNALPSTSTLLWGTTDFLVTRAEDQVRVYIIARLGNQVCGDDSFGTILPATCKLMKPAADGTAPSIPGAAALREAVRHDYYRLPGQVADFAIRHQDKWPDPWSADVAQVTRLAGHFMGGMLEGKDPLDAFVALASLAPRPGSVIPLSADTTPATIAIRTVAAALASVELDPVVRKANWPADDKRTLILFYAAKAILVNVAHDAPYPWLPKSFADGEAICSRSPIPCSQFAELAGKVDTLVPRLDTLRIRIKAFASAGDADARARAAADLVESGTQFIMRLVDVGGDKPSYRYTVITLNGLSEITRSLVAEDYAAVARQSVALADTLGFTDRMPKQAVRVLSFASDVAQAKDADGVKSALDQFVGKTTFLNKRAPASGWHMYVQAYVGAAQGREKACDAAGSCGPASKFAGAYVPVGVELGHNVSMGRFPITSIGVFVQAIDLGTLATWRYQNRDKNVADAPTVSGTQVMAPGAHVVFGVGSLPLSVGIGRSFAPKLRRFNAGGTVDERDARRTTSIFAAVDIPLFP